MIISKKIIVRKVNEYPLIPRHIRGTELIREYVKDFKIGSLAIRVGGNGKYYACKIVEHIYFGKVFTLINGKGFYNKEDVIKDLNKYGNKENNQKTSRIPYI